jgi:hypothetical protein
MAIQQPAAIAAKPKKLSVLIAGYPGIGKSTMALSAPKPLHIDTDLGIERVPAQNGRLIASTEGSYRRYN